MTSSFKTPLGKVRGLGSAKSGTEHFTLQRLTAVANLVLVPCALAVILAASFLPYDRAVRVIGHPLASIVLIGLIVSVTTHMRLGVQVVIEDYVHAEGAKLLALIANTLFALAVAIAGIYAVLRIGFAA
jgi:succinate dehydrogenase / fumarate reductase membrane anchor subunit